MTKLIYTIYTSTSVRKCLPSVPPFALNISGGWKSPPATRHGHNGPCPIVRLHEHSQAPCRSGPAGRAGPFYWQKKEEPAIELTELFYRKMMGFDGFLTAVCCSFSTITNVDFMQSRDLSGHNNNAHVTESVRREAR